MPMPSWLSDVAFVAIGGLAKSLVDAVRSRGERKSREKLSLQQGEAEFRAMLLKQNEKQQEEIDKLKNTVERMEKAMDDCENRNRKLEERIAELEATVERRRTDRTTTPVPFPPVEIEKVPH